MCVAFKEIGAREAEKSKNMSGPQCCANPPTLNPSSGGGHVEKLAGLDAYVSGSPDSKRAVLFVSDVFGTCLLSCFVFTHLQLVMVLVCFCGCGFVCFT